MSFLLNTFVSPGTLYLFAKINQLVILLGIGGKWLNRIIRKLQKKSLVMQSFFGLEYLKIESEHAFTLNMNTKEIVARIKEGDSVALKALYEAYTPMMRNVCFAIVNEDEDTVNDLVQVAFIRAYYSLHQLRDASKFGEWIAAITKNVALKHLAQKQNREIVSFSSMIGEELEQDGAISSDSILAEKEILALIDQLPKGYAQVFKMSVIEGYSHQEIAEKLGIAPHSSSSQLSRAKTMLRRIINKRNMTAIALILISIPICRYLLRFKDTDKDDALVADVVKKRNVVKHSALKNKRSDKPNLASSKVKVEGNVNKTLPIIVDSLYKDSLCVCPDSVLNKWIAKAEKDTDLIDTIVNPYSKNGFYVVDNMHHVQRHKWQLLATGILGSDLAQSAYRMFLANDREDITDGPQPSGPKAFGTWEDYYQYLLQNEHANLSDKEKALMEIAQNNMNNINNNIKNNGKIVEHEHHDKPLTFGLSVRKPFGNNWSLQTGLQYSLLKSDFTLGEGTHYINRNQKIHYLGMPLQVSYKWLDIKKWSVYTSLGGVLHIPVYGKMNEQYVTGHIMPYKDSWHFTPSVQWSIGTNIGLQYQFAPKWSIYVEPSFNWYIPNGSFYHTIWTEHPFTMTMPLGIRYSW